MAAKDDLQNLLRKIGTEEIEGQLDIVPVIPKTGAEQKNDPSTKDFDFRLLTEIEEAEFVNSATRESMAANDFQNVLDKIDAEKIKGQLDVVRVVPKTGIEQKFDPSTNIEGFDFRPLTEIEKEEFVNSPNAKSKTTFVELAGDAKSSTEWIENPLLMAAAAAKDN